MKRLAKDLTVLYGRGFGKSNLVYMRRLYCTDGDNEPIGIVLGATADKMTMEYALGGVTNQLFISRYQLYLPDRDTLERELWRLMRLDASGISR